MQIFSRQEELDLLRKRLTCRKSTLLHGPSGVGKTLLLREVMPGFNNVLYCPASSSPQAVVRRLADLLGARKDETVLRICKGSIDGLLEKSTVSLKGIVLDALRAGGYMVVLDHMNRPSPALGAMVKEVMFLCSTPVIAVARSVHMEDAGALTPLLPDRSERLGIRNFDSDAARAFALQICDEQNLAAENLNSVLDSMVKSSEGNPGALIRMITMARLEKYRTDDRIKWSPLYIDFLMEWAAANAL